MSNKYRVEMQDSVNGEKFNFAMHYEACNLECAFDSAKAEFPDATLVNARKVEPTLKEMLKQALSTLYKQAA